MRFGFHLSIAGGMAKAAERAVAAGCETLQIFTRSPRSWGGREINAVEAGSLKARLLTNNIHPLFIHLPYLPNLAAPPGDLYRRSMEMLRDDLERSVLLEASALVVHPGHRGSGTIDTAIYTAACSINKAVSASAGRARILLENTAGQGTEIGSTFRELSEIISLITEKDRIGVCLDTAHAFAAGYDLSSEKGLDRTMEEFDRVIGFNRLGLLHLNDSKACMGSRVDRHWHIGEGQIGIKAFRRIINHPVLTGMSAIMETPKINGDDDLRNMRTIRSIYKPRP